MNFTSIPPTAAAIRRLAEHPSALHVIFDPTGDEALFCEIWNPDTDNHDLTRPDHCPYLDPDSDYYHRNWSHWGIATHQPPAPTSHSHWRST